MDEEAHKERAALEHAAALKRGREEATGGAQETPEDRKKRRADDLAAMKKKAGGDIMAYLLKLFNEKKDPDDDDIALLAGILSAALESSDDDEPEPQPEPDPEFNITPKSLRPLSRDTAAEAENAVLQTKIAELERQLRASKMMKPMATMEELAEPQPVPDTAAV